MFEKIKKFLTKNSEDNEAPHDSMRNRIHEPWGFYPPAPLAYTFYKGNTYDNTYPSIKAIVNAFMTIRPYAIDSNGKPLKEANVVDCLYRPNKQMSAIDFREALAVMTLVHPKVYLLLWRKENGVAKPGGTITEENLIGFTFMEGVSELRAGGKKYYQWNGRTYNTDEVIEIFSGYDPYNLGRGYSPSQATHKWASVDDYIAAYQAGFFENGAVPSGQFLITAKTPEEYKKIVDGMQGAHRGSGRNNNVIYAHRPIDPNSGAAASAQIEWVPFAQTNKEMSLDSVFKQANDKIDSAFGVPASIRGVNDNNTYASVRVDEQNFVKYTVKPFAEKIYSRLNHELNRVTDGMGYAISFSIDIPGVADEEKTEAERKLTEFNLINAAVMAGYSLDSVVDAFELSNGYKTLKMGNQTPTIVNDKPEVDEGGEVESAPAADSGSKAKSTTEHTCHHHHKVAQTKEELAVIDDISEVLREQMEKQIEQAIDGHELNKDVEDASDDDTNELVEKILAILLVYMLLKGRTSYKDGIKILKANDIPITTTTEFVVNSATQAAYQTYLKNVATSYTSDTATQIRNTLAKGQTLGWSKEQLATELRNIMKTDEWRVQRLARTEEHRASNQASVDAMTQLMNETNTKIYKVWHTNSNEPCEFCQSLNGKKELVNKTFLPVGDSVTGSDGGTFTNTFVDVNAADLHPNCHCYVTFEVEKNA